MRFAARGFALVAVLGMAACAGNPNRPTDTGNMATPTPLQSGVIGTSRPSGPDTGNMALPRNAPEQTGLRASPDALGSMGQMQSPSSSQGNLRRQVQ